MSTIKNTIRSLNQRITRLAELDFRNPRFPGSWAMQKVFRIRGQVACPKCLSGIGFDCRTKTGVRVRRMHDARVLCAFRAGLL